MSAIAAVIRLDGRAVHAEEVSVMIDRMAHRGPHGRHVATTQNVGLGHCAMHLLPETGRGSSPMTLLSGRVIVSAVARLDNRAEILRSLDAGRASGDASDEELLAEAYLAWGRDFPQRLLGTFTYVIWDERDRTLHCGRDHLGFRPLYYVHHPHRMFACATEIKALLALEDVAATRSEVMTAYYIESLTEEPEKTIYEEVLRVPRATRLEVGAGGLTSHQYWDLEVPPTAAGTDESFAAGFRDVFDEAVRARIRSRRPVGAQLSGGLDSSYVACRALQLMPEEQKPLRSYSILFADDEAADESAYIRTMTSQAGIEPRFLSVEGKGPLDYLEWIYSVLDDGVVGGNHVTQMALMHAAAEDGCGVLLDGIDGDTTVEHGYPRFRSLADAGQWRAFYDLARASGARLEDSQAPDTANIGRQFKRYAFNRYAQPAIAEMVGQRKYLKAFRALRTARSEGLTSWKGTWAQLRADAAQQAESQAAMSFLKDDVVRDLDLHARLKAYSTPYGNDDLQMRERQQRLHMSGKRARIFEMMDHLSASLQMEIRHPFMDLRLISYCLALPEEQSLKDGWTRYVMRNAMAGSVPDVITWRGDKADMSNVFRKGLFGSNFSLLEELLRSPGVLKDYVDQDRIDTLLSRSRVLSQPELVKLSSYAIVTFWLNHRFTSHG
jgi:asparagine synthase (glutamine-hydrolysing)